MDVIHTLYTSMRFDFLYVDSYVFKKGWIYPESMVPYCMLRYIEKGEALFKINGTEFNVKENDVVYIPQGAMLYCDTQSEPFSFISIRFRLTAQLNRGDFLADYYHIPTVTDASRDEKAHSLFKEVHQAAISEKRSKIFKIRGSLELIIAYLAEKTEEDGLECIREEGEEDDENLYTIDKMLKREFGSSKRSQDPRIAALTDYILSNIDNDFTSYELAKMVDLSESSMRRLFKQHTGKSPLEFIRDMRLVVAARRLLVSNETIAQIAYSVGINDLNYFSRIFKKNYGISPQEYRRKSN